MDTKDMLTLAVAALSLLVSVVSLFHTMWSYHRFKRLDALQEVRSVAIPNLSGFNGILNKSMVAAQPLSSNEELELGKLYAEVRDAYNIRRHYFGIADRFRIDNDINKLETAFLNDPNRSTMTTFSDMHNIMKLIELNSR